MQTIPQQLQERVESALRGTLAASFSDFDSASLSPDATRVVPCANAQFGDYQWNGALALAKILKTNPRALATQIIAELKVDDLSAPPEIAGAGFVNFRLRLDWLARAVAQVVGDARCGVPQTSSPRVVVVDYPSPNVAKPLHVGHIRTTFIGDAIARLLRFVGHKVIADSHIGDWGTPIGMVIWGWKRLRDDAAFERNALEEMGRIYKIVKALTTAKNEQDVSTKEAHETLAQVRAETAKLQSGDEENLSIWQKLRAASQVELDAMYQRLDIHIDETLGESFYNDRLSPLVQDLTARGLAKPSEGAIIIEFEDAALSERPMLIQKSDGSFLYATTDLATVQYRVERWHPDEIVYVVGTPQSLHFQQLFAAVKMCGYDHVALKHVSFGTVLGTDGKPLRTREGDPPKLSDLLDEAQRRALEVVREKNPDLSPAQHDEVARVIGIGAIKYADLSQNRTSDYTFAWDKMLAMQGNSAPYLLFAYVRIRSIFRRAALDQAAVHRLAEGEELTLEHDAEIALAKFLLRFHEPIETALLDYRLNALSDYLFELAQKFSAFIEACRVLDSPEPARSSRLSLCLLTANILQCGLNLLGLETIEQM